MGEEEEEQPTGPTKMPTLRDLDTDNKVGVHSQLVAPSLVPVLVCSCRLPRIYYCGTQGISNIYKLVTGFGVAGADSGALVWGEWQAWKYLEATHQSKAGASWYSALGFKESKNFVSRAKLFVSVINAKADSLTTGTTTDKIRAALRHYEKERGTIALGRYMTEVVQRRKRAVSDTAAAAS